MSDPMSDRDPRAVPRNDVRQHFEFLMLHPPQLRKHVLNLRLLSAIGLLRLAPRRPSPKCADLLLQGGPAVMEVSEEMLRQVLCDDVALLKLHERIWGSEAGAYWAQKIENELEAEAGLELDPEVDARIKATVAARVREAFSDDPVVVANPRFEWATAFTSGPRAITRQFLEGYIAAGSGNNVVTLDEGNDMGYASDWSNMMMADEDDVSINVGKGDNRIVAGLGRHTIQVGNGSNILIDGSVQLTQNGDSFRQVLDDWITYRAQAANTADTRSRLLLTCNTHYANTLPASGLDWFWATDTLANLNAKPTDLWN